MKVNGDGREAETKEAALVQNDAEGEREREGGTEGWGGWHNLGALCLTFPWQDRLLI